MSSGDQRTPQSLALYSRTEGNKSKVLFERNLNIAILAGRHDPMDNISRRLMIITPTVMLQGVFAKAESGGCYIIRSTPNPGHRHDH